MAEPPWTTSTDFPTLFRAQDLESRGIPRGRVRSWLRTGKVHRVARGVYRVADAPYSELESILAVSTMVPDGIVCLLTALRVHEIGTQSPSEVWLAIANKAWTPDTGPWKVRFVRWSGVMLRYAVEEIDVQGVKVRITSPARTVVDCFRYRRKIGIDVAIEALEDVLRTGKATVAELTRAAEVCRASNVMRPYLQSIAR